ncbi:MAG TPA: DinB family protein [Candidatus Sulfotelmatobacter sp.]|nr:DinB family protein [Candidatus Sulfotelmatobacter sp.]
MTNREFFIECWEQEAPAFVKVMKAVPADKLDYRPHPRSRSAAELVWVQVLEKHCWFELLDSGKITWKVPPPPVGLEEMIADYQKTHAELALRLRQVDEKAWNEQMTQFLLNDRVVFETVMGHMFWTGLFDAIHHRGQLSVYLRPMGGKVPAIYTASADDPGLGHVLPIGRLD